VSVNKVLIDFPFLREYAKSYKDLEVSKLLQSPEYREARDLFFLELKSALNPDGYHLEYGRYENDSIFYAYMISKIFLSNVNDPVLTSKYINLKRDRVEKAVLKNLEAGNKTINYDIIKSILENWNIKYEFDGSTLKISFLKYIMISSDFTDKNRLISQKLNDGMIYFNLESDKKKIALFIREYFVKAFKEEIQKLSEHSIDMEEYFKEELSEILVLRDSIINRYNIVDLGEFEIQALPPCIKEILAKIDRGVNIPHLARFTLVTFLNQIGMSKDEIMQLFTKAPDFNEKLTEYQVSHIIGESSGKEYSAPKCKTMELYSLCVKYEVNDRLCFQNFLTHPILYYKIKKKKNNLDLAPSAV
jgi:DNA primase large subunit